MISILLSLVSAAREQDFEKHMQAERKMLQLIHAFDHVHYLRYLTYQHVTFSYFKMTKHPIFSDLKINGFAAQYSEEKFSAVHGDLVTEYYNRETKSCHGPFRLGFITNVSVMNKWVRNINSHAQLRKELRGTLSMKVNSAHKVDSLHKQIL